MPTKLNNAIIEAAIVGFESEKAKIDRQIAELRAMLSGAPAAIAPQAVSTKRKKFSAASRRKMALAQKARWARVKGESEPAAPAKLHKPKRKLSAAGKKAIRAALKRRWALKRAEAANVKKASPRGKKAAPKKPAPASPSATPSAAA